MNSRKANNLSIRGNSRKNSPGIFFPSEFLEQNKSRLSNIEYPSSQTKTLLQSRPPRALNPKTENTPPRKHHAREISISSNKQASGFKKTLESRIKEISRSNRKGDPLSSVTNSLYESPSKKVLTKEKFPNSAFKGTRNVFDEITENLLENNSQY